MQIFWSQLLIAIFSCLIILLSSIWRDSIYTPVEARPTEIGQIDIFRNDDTIPENQSPIPNHIPQNDLSTGQFIIVYQPTSSDRFKALEQVFQTWQGLELLAEGLNKTVKIPFNIPMILTSCNEANAFYHPQEKKISICYEFIWQATQLFHSAQGGDVAQALDKAGDVILFIAYHEVGHALVNILDIPITGREEDAVDDLAALILLDSNNQGLEKKVLNAALYWALQANASEGKLAYWGEHSLDLQRFFSLICLLYGKSPDRYSHLITKNIIPESRAARCPREYEKKLSSWNRLLAPHLVNSPNNDNTNVTPNSAPAPLW